VSERDESATGAETPVKPKKRKKKKKRPKDAAARVVAPPMPLEPLPSGDGKLPALLIMLGGIATAIGLGLTGTEPLDPTRPLNAAPAFSEAGRVFWIGGILLFVAGIHLMGRAGPDLGTR
jgi:hypothetical protein